MPYRVQTVDGGHRVENVELLSKRSVHYRPASSERRCGNCSMFRARTKTCTLVEGVILPEMTCNRWASKRPGIR